MEAYFDHLDEKQKEVINDLCEYTIKRTQLNPIIMLSIPTFKLTQEVMVAIDITKTYLGLYTTDQDVINEARSLLETALFGNCTVKVDYRDKNNIKIIKMIIDQIVMKHMTFNIEYLIKSLDDEYEHFRDLAYQYLLEVQNENELKHIDYRFFLTHEKKDYVSKGIGLLLNAVTIDEHRSYDSLLIDYFKVLDHPLISIVLEALEGLGCWILYKPYLKQMIKTYLNTVSFSRFKPHQIDKIRVEIEKIKGI